MARRRQWEDFAFDLDISSGAQSAPVALTRAPAGEVKGLTLVRTIISLAVIPLDMGSISGAPVQQVYCGLGVTGEEAVNAGGSSVADPADPVEFPPSGWLYRDVRLVVDDSTPGYPWQRFEIDLRAQRKLMYGVPFLKFTNLPQQGTAFTISVVGCVRCLYLLP